MIKGSVHTNFRLEARCDHCGPNGFGDDVWEESRHIDAQSLPQAREIFIEQLRAEDWQYAGADDNRLVCPRCLAFEYISGISEEYLVEFLSKLHSASKRAIYEWVHNFDNQAKRQGWGKGFDEV